MRNRCNAAALALTALAGCGVFSEAERDGPSPLSSEPSWVDVCQVEVKNLTARALLLHYYAERQQIIVGDVPAHGTRRFAADCGLERIRVTGMALNRRGTFIDATEVTLDHEQVAQALLRRNY